MEDTEVLMHLAGGAVLIRDEDGFGADIVTRHGRVDSTQFNRLMVSGMLKGFANGGGAWISDEGKKAYLRSTDELAPSNDQVVRPAACGRSEPTPG